MIEILERILTEKLLRKQLIRNFQEKIWNADKIGDEEENKILSELAYDLDFYEPDETLRKEDLSYYGDERLEEEVKSVLEKLKK